MLTIRRNTTGFTLIELLITLVVLALLVSIALPVYTGIVRRGNQSAAQEFMMEVASRANQYRLDTRIYPTDLGTGAGELNMTTPDKVADYYTITINADNAATPPTFTVVATPKSSTPQAGMATMELSSAGLKTPPEAWK